MKAVELPETSGPDALRVVDRDAPEASHFMSPGEGVVIDVRAAAVSFPDVLQTRGLYQVKPDVPFVPGAEVAGVVAEASEGSGFSPGDRVAAMTVLGGMAERAAAPPAMTFPLHDSLDFAEGAALVMNYHTAYFALTTRGRLAEGEQVLVHGAAGGVGTATLQVAKALGASTIAVVSTDEKERVARDAGADAVVRSDGPWRDEVKEASGGGVDVVIDAKPQVTAEIQAELDRMIADGAVKPIVGARFRLEQAADAMKLILERGATGKVVLEVGEA